jgi:hypothetical protein
MQPPVQFPKPDRGVVGKFCEEQLKFVRLTNSQKSSQNLSTDDRWQHKSQLKCRDYLRSAKSRFSMDDTMR